MDCLLHCISLSKTQIHNGLNFHARLLYNPEKLIATLNKPCCLSGPPIAAQLTWQSQPYQDSFKWPKLWDLFQVRGESWADGPDMPGNISSWWDHTMKRVRPSLKELWRGQQHLSSSPLGRRKGTHRRLQDAPWALAPHPRQPHSCLFCSCSLKKEAIWGQPQCPKSTSTLQARLGPKAAKIY